MSFERVIRRLRFVAATACSMAFGVGAVAQISVYPPSPSALETVRLLVPENEVVADLLAQGFNYVRAERTRISMASNHIVVTLVLTNNGFPTTQSPAFDVPLGQLPSGDYQLEVRRQSENGTGLPSLGQISFSIAERGNDDPLWNNTDMWWNSSESGWGISVVQHGTRNIFSTFYLYDGAGNPIWYVTPGGKWLSSTTFQGTVYRTSGPEFGTSFDPSKVTVNPVGTAIFNFVPFAYDRASVTITIDGKTVTKDIQRQSF